MERNRSCARQGSDDAQGTAVIKFLNTSRVCVEIGMAVKVLLGCLLGYILGERKGSGADTQPTPQTNAPPPGEDQVLIFAPSAALKRENANLHPTEIFPSKVTRGSNPVEISGRLTRVGAATDPVIATSL